MSDSRITVINRNINNLTQTISNNSDNETLRSISLERSSVSSSSSTSDGESNQSICSDGDSFNHSENKPEISQTSKSKLLLEEILERTKRKKQKKLTDREQPYTMSLRVKDSSILKFNKKIHKPRVRISLYNNVGQILHKKSKLETNLNENAMKFNFLTAPGQILSSTSFSFIWLKDSTVEFDEEIDYLKLRNFLIFFELIDNSTSKSSDDWHCIAWSFLRLADNETPQYKNETIHLQLFKYQHKSMKFETIFSEFSKRKRQKYPAILNIVINCKKFNAPDETTEISSRRPSTNPSEMDHNGIFNSTDLNWQHVMTKLRTRTFETPQKIIYKHCCNSASGKGSSVACFSPDSSLLAFTEIYRNFSIIIIFNVLMFEKKFQLNGHEGNIHNLNWLQEINDDGGRILVSSSEDQTCIVWKISENSYSILHVLYHPTFVYCAIFFENSLKGLYGIATGCRDGILRIWSANNTKDNLNLLQELNNHKSYIICLAFNERSNRLYSGEYSGVIIEWKLEKKNWHFRRKLTTDKKKLRYFDLSSLLNRLYVLTLTNLTAIELTSGFQNVLLKEIPATDGANKLTVSQCGTFIFIAFRNRIICWSVKSKQIIKEFHFHDYISSIDFNYENNILAVSNVGVSGRIGEFLMIGPEKFFTIQNLSSNYQESKQRDIFGMSTNSHFNVMLKKLDTLFNFDEPIADDDDNDIEDKMIAGQHNMIQSNNDSDPINPTFSINLNQTFSVSEENVNKTFSIQTKQHDRKIETFEIVKADLHNNNNNNENDSSHDETDISQSLEQ